MASDFSRPTAFKVPHESADHPPPPGLSFPLADYLSKAPEAKVLWIVRHPLDAICSLRIGIEQDWGHHPRPPNWRDWLHRPLLERCAHHWAFLNSVGFANVRTIATVVSFERMIADPLQFALEVCAEADMPVASALPHVTRWADRVQDTNSAQFVEAATSRNYSRRDHERRVERWRENLTPADVASLWPLVEEAALDFGYAPPDETPRHL
ncbi:MAG: hypothetical protein ACJ798_01295 [Phenylobacterium sp.]